MIEKIPLKQNQKETLKSLKDAELVQVFREEKNETRKQVVFQVLYNRYDNLVSHLILKSVKNTEDVQDLKQVIFTRVFNALNNSAYKEEGFFKA